MLVALTSRLERQVDDLLDEARALYSLPTMGMPERRQAEHLAFHMQLLWDRYVRTFVLASAAGVASDMSGVIAPSVPTAFRSKEAACHYLISTYRRRTMEPDWYKPIEAVDAANRLAISNLAKFVGAVGSTPWLLDELRFTRNFFAHRSKRSALEVRNSSWFANHRKIEAENTIFDFDVGGLRKIEVWGLFIKNISNAMI